MSYFVHKACKYRLILLVQTTAYVRYLMAEVDPSAVGNILNNPGANIYSSD